MVSAGGLALESVSITHAPNKTEYATGDTFDKTGMVVTANFNNDVSFVTTDYTVSPETLTAAVTAVTISVTVDGVTRTTTQAVTVLDKAKLTYTGNMTSKQITSGGTVYTLYTFTSSGTLTVAGSAKNVGIWLCGGGCSSNRTWGGAGGYTAQNLNYTLNGGTYNVVIGAANGNTTIKKGDTVILTANGATNDSNNGGSGGGARGNAYNNTYKGGIGQGTTTRPFDDSVNFPSLPCAGGGGGASFGDNYANGGAGGSNGGNGGDGGPESSSVTLMRTNGGKTGGGKGKIKGGNDTAANATYYGSGGGGRFTGSSSTETSVGYQGVMFIRVPV